MCQSFGVGKFHSDSHKEWAISSRYCSFGRNVLTSLKNERTGRQHNILHGRKKDRIILLIISWRLDGELYIISGNRAHSILGY